MNFDFNKEKIIAGVSVVVAVVVAFYGGYHIGSGGGEPLSASVTPSATTSVSFSNSTPASFGADFSMFWQAVDIIKSDYYKADQVNDTQLLHGAIKGAVGSLEDPYSSFFPPSDAKRFQQNITGSFGGIGAEIGMREGGLVIISPLEGTPADQVGLKPKDRILKVDDTFTDDINIEEAVEIIRGEIGTTVTLTIMREEWSEPQEIDITRANIEIPTLDWQMYDGDIAYIKLYSFNASAASLFAEASLQALRRGPRGVILDLRNNSGGFLDVANNIAGWFVKRGDVVVQERFPGGKTREFVSQGNSAWSNVPVIVLVNEGSASASEIVAGALRDQLGATLVGEQTFGKGTVQEVESLPDGSKMKISIAEWITPNGTEIEGKGVSPDVVLEVDESEQEGEEDVQLQRALEIIREKVQDVKSIPTIILN